MKEACKPTSICLYVAYLKIYPNHSTVSAPSEDVTQLYSALLWLQEKHQHLLRILLTINMRILNKNPHR